MISRKIWMTGKSWNFHIVFYKFQILREINLWRIHSVKKRENHSMKKVSSNQLFSKFFSKVVDFTEFLVKRVWESISEMLQILREINLWRKTQCGKTRNSLYEKKFRQINSSANSLVKSLISRNFWSKKCESEFLMLQILREIN